MDVVYAKALNSSLGTGEAKGFNSFLGEQIQKINEAIESNSQKESEKKKELKGLVCANSDSPENIYKCVSVKLSPLKMYTETMECDGSIRIPVVNNTSEIPYKAYVIVELNDIEIPFEGKDVIVKFKKGDVLNIRSAGLSGAIAEEIVFLFAREVNYTGLTFY